MTLSDDSIPLESLPITEKLAVCFGCEETGLDKEIEDNADYKVQIPINGFTQSYNVSVSASISLYYLYNKIKKFYKLKNIYILYFRKRNALNY